MSHHRHHGGDDDHHGSCPGKGRRRRSQARCTLHARGVSLERLGARCPPLAPTPRLAGRVGYELHLPLHSLHPPHAQAPLLHLCTIIIIIMMLLV